MSKDILERARQEANSEYEDSVYNDTLNRSTIFLTVLCILLWISRALHMFIYSLDGLFPISEALIILMGFLAFMNLSLYRRLGNKKNRGAGIVFGMFFIRFLAEFLLSLFGGAL